MGVKGKGEGKRSRSLPPFEEWLRLVQCVGPGVFIGKFDQRLS